MKHLLLLLTLNSMIMSAQNLKLNPLTEFETFVIKKKGTERPFSGKYWNHEQQGIYLCKQCNAPLYTSDSKFDGHCGWPSFDDEIEGAVDRILDADGRRTEIVCHRCKGHLGHVFEGERFTLKNTRHCVNSVSLKFVPLEEYEKKMKDSKIKTAIFASGCFWGTEYYFSKAKGVLTTTVGYIGGHVDNPTYRQVSAKTTGHFEAVKVEYDSTKTDYETLVKLFFETHDPEQKDGQGPDIGPQYRSAVFVYNAEERTIVEQLIERLEKKGYDIATTIIDATTFWEAEAYHQDYYDVKGSTPYCHFYKKKFD